MININIGKAKAIAHDIRRRKRALEFAPLDVKATIPSESVAAEIARQAVRNKYAETQASINAATGVPELKLIIDNL